MIQEMNLNSQRANLLSQGCQLHSLEAWILGDSPACAFESITSPAVLMKMIAMEKWPEEDTMTNKITVEIGWDVPPDSNWLNADNVALALHAYYPNTKFTVENVVGPAISIDIDAVEGACLEGAVVRGRGGYREGR